MKNRSEQIIKTIKIVNHPISCEVNPYTELLGVMPILASWRRALK